MAVPRQNQPRLPDSAALPWTQSPRAAVEPDFWFSVLWAALMVCHQLGRHLSFLKVPRRRSKEKWLTRPQWRWGDPAPLTAVAWAGHVPPGSASASGLGTSFLRCPFFHTGMVTGSISSQGNGTCMEAGRGLSCSQPRARRLAQGSVPGGHVSMPLRGGGL